MLNGQATAARGAALPQQPDPLATGDSPACRTSSSAAWPAFSSPRSAPAICGLAWAEDEMIGRWQASRT